MFALVFCLCLRDHRLSRLLPAALLSRREPVCHRSVYGKKENQLEASVMVSWSRPPVWSRSHIMMFDRRNSRLFFFLFNEVNELVRMSDCPTRGPFCFCADAAVSRRCFGVAEHLLSSLLHRRGRLLAVNLAPC